jgi:hypothetical protein
MDPELWFMDTLENKGTHFTDIYVTGLTMALTACNRCPLRLECLTLGMNEEDRPYGIWGGLLPGERHKLAGETKFNQHRKAIERARYIRVMTGVKPNE